MWKPGSTIMRPWLTALVICVGLVTAVIAVPLIVRVWSVQTSGGRIKGIALAFIIVVPLFLLWFGILKATWDWRLRALTQQFPDSIVSTVVRSGDTVDRFTSASSVALSRKSLPKFMAIVANDYGFELWGGVVHPSLRWSLPWSKVRSIDPGNVRVGARQRRINMSSVNFAVRSESGEILIPLAFVGSRYLGFLNARPLEALQIADALTALRSKERYIDR